MTRKAPTFFGAEFVDGEAKSGRVVCTLRRYGFRFGATVWHNRTVVLSGYGDCPSSAALAAEAATLAWFADIADSLGYDVIDAPKTVAEQSSRSNCCDCQSTVMSDCETCVLTNWKGEP